MDLPGSERNSKKRSFGVPQDDNGGIACHGSASGFGGRWGVREIRPMLGLGELLLFHQDRHELRQGGDFLVLNTHDRQQLENDQKEEDRHADQREGVVLDPKHFARDPVHALRPEREAHEREADQEEQECVAFLEPIFAQSSNGQQQEQATEDQEEEVLKQVHATSPFRWARGRGPDPAAGRRSPSSRKRARSGG